MRETEMKTPVKLTDIASVEAVLQEMTLDEKLYMLTGGSGFGTKEIPRLGIPAMMMVDSAAGVNLAQYYGDLYSRVQIREGLPFKSLAGVTNTEEMGAILTAKLEGRALEGELAEKYRKIVPEKRKLTDVDEWPSCFPTGMLMASTWNPEVVERCGYALGREADSLGVNVLMGTPDANIQRDPRGGRVFECYTEDPCLMSNMAPAMVRGVQRAGIFANAKHFAANNQETARQSVDENISERALHEIYLPGFRACVEQGGLKTMMGAYNHINGVGCSMNRWLNTDVLREEWGFDGFVMSDWGGVYDQVQAIRAGNDLDMPGIRNMQPVKDAVEAGELSIEEVDACVRRILKSIAENPSFKRSERPRMDRALSQSAAYEAASEGIVLLKNAGALPLKPGARAALYGEGSVEFRMTGRQSSRVFTDRRPRLADTLSERLGEDHVRVGCAGEDTDVVLLTLQSEGTEGRDRKDLTVDDDQREALEAGFAAARERGVPAVLILNIAAPIDIREYVDRADAILSVFYPGVEGARALADILFGKVSPSGHLSLTYPRRVEDCPAYGFFPGANHLALYNEDVFVGYRYYDLKDVAPLYPFGYGLSYTKFELSNARLDRAELDQDSCRAFKLFVDVKNAGDMAGKTVVQVYLNHASDMLPRPVRELKAFQKLMLAPGEARTVEFELSVDQLASFDPRFHKWIAEAGEYDFEIGFHSRDLPLRARLKLSGHTPYDLGDFTPIKRIMARPEAYQILLDNFAPFSVRHADFADCLKYFPDKELGVVIRELIENKHLDAQDARLRRAIERVYSELACL